MSVFVPGNIPKHLITQRKKKPKLLPPVCRPLSITTTCMNAGGATQPTSRKSKVDFPSQQPTPVLQTRRRKKSWTEDYRSQERMCAREPGGRTNWTLMHLFFCVSIMLPVRPRRGPSERSRSGWAPWCCSTAKPRGGSSSLGRNRNYPPPQRH